jgi:hypothetical protein
MHGFARSSRDRDGLKVEALGKDSNLPFARKPHAFAGSFYYFVGSREQH